MYHLKFATICISFLVFALFCDKTNAKSGCALFGHSCYGGIGKRADMSSGESLETNVPESNSPALFIPGFHSGFRISKPIRYIQATPEQYKEVSQFLDKKDLIEQE
ncbi:uncharacterized protein LOC126734080 [Anthonomus grandis grandis]|uniref:uncharacterized protein LOC126734080 n=1 Tax=Anthonomus grandis grandis TaxID=2921223 RepID=UPI002166AFB4|nr:uncharacterized protein LOC126734080 [Anthonomus grandis grandis]